MAANNLTISDDRLLAEYVGLDQFRGFFEHRLGISPDTLALLIRDGKIVLASHGANIGMGGMWQSIKDALIGRHSLRLLLADLKPFQLTSAIKAVTRDHVEVQGELTVDFQVNPEKPANIIGLMKDHECVVKADVLKLLEPHFDDRVLEAVIGRAGALELRGNTELQDKVQADIMKEVERIAGDLGIIARAVSLKWAFNDDELAELDKRRKHREQEMLEVDFEILKRQIERESQTTELRLTTNVSEEKLRAANEADIRKLVLGQELAFSDARDTGLRIAQVKMLEHELALNKTQRLDQFQASLDTAKNQIDIARLTEEMRGVQRTTEELDTKSRLMLRQLEQLQELEIARKAHADQAAAIRELGIIDREREAARHALEMEEKRQRDQAALEKIKGFSGLSPDQIMAINAGLSPEVANILVEQARARAGEGREGLMRELIAQAKEARLDSAAQAATFFAEGMKGAVGVAAGVGTAAGVGVAARQPKPDVVVSVQSAECPACHRSVPESDRFCRACGHQMRT